MSKVSSIYLIEDDITLAEMYCLKLELAGYQVDAFHDGSTSLAALAKTVPDLLILDIVLPKVNGFQLLKEIRKTSHTKHLPVVILTNLAQADANLSDSLARSMGISSYLVKSKTTPSQLLEQVHIALAQSPAG